MLDPTGFIALLFSVLNSDLRAKDVEVLELGKGAICTRLLLENNEGLPTKLLGLSHADLHYLSISGE